MMIGWVRSHLGVKLFLSYLVVIIVGIVVLAVAAEVAVPQSFNRHMTAMAPMMDGESLGMGMGMSSGTDLEADLFVNFRAAVNEALLVAALAAFLVAGLASVFISRQVVAPVQEMMAASGRIAEGHYEERVQVATDSSRGDPDELGQLAISFNRMANELEEVEVMRQQLIGDISHELRTPLTTIKGSMEGLIDGVLEASPETFQEIYREADRLQRLVADLQELSRVEAGAYELHLQPAEIADLVSASIARLQIQYDEKTVALETSLPPDMSLVTVDEDRINQVLINLLGNALQYTPPGGTARVAAQEIHDEIRVSITDSGVGIAGDDLPHLFTRFYRADKSRSRAVGGSGIGLTIARHFVEAHGGRIWVESAGPGQGSTFTFTLPIDTPGS
ncbi:MAG: ATP-binding protein [Anaerolineales bacterium]|nr:ATP-binding protein [Anaerolineales bacterium]